MPTIPGRVRLLWPRAQLQRLWPATPSPAVQRWLLGCDRAGRSRIAQYPHTVASSLVETPRPRACKTRLSGSCTSRRELPASISSRAFASRTHPPGNRNQPGAMRRVDSTKDESLPPQASCPLIHPTVAKPTPGSYRYPVGLGDVEMSGWSERGRGPSGRVESGGGLRSHGGIPGPHEPECSPLLAAVLPLWALCALWAGPAAAAAD